MSNCKTCDSDEYRALPYNHILRELCDYSHGESLGHDYVGPLRISTVVFPHHGVSTLGDGSDNIETLISERTENGKQRTVLQRWHGRLGRERAVKLHNRLVRLLTARYSK